MLGTTISNSVPPAYVMFIISLGLYWYILGPDDYGVGMAETPQLARKPSATRASFLKRSGSAKTAPQSEDLSKYAPDETFSRPRTLPWPESHLAQSSSFYGGDIDLDTAPSSFNAFTPIANSIAVAPTSAPVPVPASNTPKEPPWESFNTRAVDDESVPNSPLRTRDCSNSTSFSCNPNFDMQSTHSRASSHIARPRFEVTQVWWEGEHPEVRIQRHRLYVNRLFGAPYEERTCHRYCTQRWAWYRRLCGLKPCRCCRKLCCGGKDDLGEISTELQQPLLDSEASDPPKQALKPDRKSVV